MTKSLPAILTLLLLPTLLTGCLERTITITSQPTGALVHLNDREVGRTPVVVPFTFYGTYTVRLEHDGVWVPDAQAAVAYGLTPDQLEEAVNTGKLQTRQGQNGREIRVDYAPMLVNQKAEAPAYEYPGLDLIAEAVPGRHTVNLDWHFEMQQQPIVNEADLIERAEQIRQKLNESVGETESDTGKKTSKNISKP